MKKFILGGIVFFGLIILYSSYFIVSETEQVIITQFGKPVRESISKAGIYLKIPLIEEANVFEKRILEWDGDVSNPIPTKDKKNIIIDTTARWKIVDPLMFLQSVGNFRGAQSRLDDIIDSNVRDVISRHALIEIVRNSNRVVDVIKKEAATESFASADKLQHVIKEIKLGRQKITREILKKSQPIISKYGIELIDVRIKGLMYSQNVLQTVYKRMMSQYGIRAQNLRSQGDKEKSQIEGDTEYQLKKIRSEAYKKAQIIRGEGDATAAKTYAQTLQIDPDFYQFQRSLEAYSNSIKGNTTLILSSNSEFFKVLSQGSK